MFSITFICRPAAKFLLKHPLVGFLVISTIYVYVAYRVLLSAWEHNYRKTASTREIADRWQQSVTYTKRE